MDSARPHRLGADLHAVAGERSAHPLRFPLRLPPQLIHYDGTALELAAGELAQLELRAPEAAVRQAGTGGARRPSASGAAELVRLGLLKRLESGRAPALASIRRHLSFLRAFIAAAERGRLLRAGGHGPGARADADPAQLLILDLVADPVPSGLDLRALVASAERDRARLTGLLATLSAPDPKVARCRQLVAAIAPERVVIFTEYRDTAQALWRALADFRVARVDGGGGWLGLRPASRRAVLERFAPAAMGQPEPVARERVDVLVATDVFGEGVDLQDARHVISFDLPWNPVRLLQRTGRVDRLGSPHREVVPYLFVPDGALDALLGLTRRIRGKLIGITGTVGAEGAPDLLECLGRGSAAVAEALDWMALSGDPVMMESLRRLWERTPRDDALAAERKLPRGSRTAAPVDVGSDPVILVRAAGKAWLLQPSAEDGGPALREADHTAVVTIQAALPLLHADRPVPAVTLAAVDRMVERFLAEIRSRRRAPAAVPGGAAVARVAAAIRTWAEVDGTAAGPTTLARADRLLARLAKPPGPAVERRLRTLLHQQPVRDGMRAWITAIEEALGVEPPLTPPEDSAAGWKQPGTAARPDPITGSRADTILALIPGSSRGWEASRRRPPGMDRAPQNRRVSGRAHDAPGRPHEAVDGAGGPD